MLLGVVYLVAALAGAAFVLAVGLYRYHSETGLFATLSLAAWAVLAFQADAVEVVTNSGSIVTRSEPTLQYLSLGLAIVSGLAVVGALSGKWPQDNP